MRVTTAPIRSAPALHPAEDAATRLLMPRTPDSLALDSQQKPSAKRWKCGAAELTRQVDNI